VASAESGEDSIKNMSWPTTKKILLLFIFLRKKIKTIFFSPCHVHKEKQNPIF